MIDAKRTSSGSATNGPRRRDGASIVTRCLDCSRTAKRCPAQAGSRWPATTIPEDCPLPSVGHEDDVEDISDGNNQICAGGA